jgi:phenylacetate-CoA ligase
MSTVARGAKRKAISPRPPASAAAFFNRLASYRSEDWMRLAHSARAALFRRMAESVPAYKDFLRLHGTRPGEVNTPEDISSVPPVNKANYLRTHELRELSWKGDTRTASVLTSTSGSTGKPTYFARSSEVDEHSSYIHELIFRSSSLKKNESTLVIVCFGMGVWIGGLITYQAFERMARRGYPISILTPGINKAEILKALTDLAPQYEQLILAGYPPFLKDVIDEATARGISFGRHRVKLLFAAEAFTEHFREHVGTRAGVRNLLTDAINIYGSADLGTMAFETPLSILARRLAVQNKAIFADLFGGISKTPTFAQFIPDFVSFEASNGELLVTGDSSIPLFRYAIGDHGGVYSFDDLCARFAEHGIDLRKEAEAAGIAMQYELPFVYVYERIDLSTTLYGLQIYPEIIKEVLLDKRFSPHLTGKLTLITKFDDNQDQYLEINIEKKPNARIEDGLSPGLVAEIVKNLREKNSEFHELSDFLGARAEPKIVFWDYEDPLYFKPGIKQPWVVRSA